MTNTKLYVPFAIVALVAGLVGWGGAIFANRQTVEATPAPVASQLAPVAFAQPQTAVLPDGQLVTLQPIQTAQPVAYAAQPIAPVTQAVPVQARSAAQRAAPVYRNTRESVSSAPARKRGMSNKTKAAIAIGGGAGVGAAIGGIAKGGKGAAIGAIAGGGAAAVYSWIKHKKNQPVF